MENTRGSDDGCLIEPSSSIYPIADVLLTDPNLNPSTAFVNMANPNAIQITATGFDPYVTLFFRWGDYSASTLDPNGKNIWMGNEYVPPPSFQVLPMNWGTEVFEQ
jgi:hypothetical protein